MDCRARGESRSVEEEDRGCLEREGWLVTERRFDEELQRRLEAIEAPDYEDPARRDLPAADLVVLVALVVVAVVGLYWWGY